MLSHTTARARSKFRLQRNACEDARDVCATARPACCTKTCPLSLRKNMTREPCLERHPKHKVSRHEHVRKQVSKQWHVDRCETVQLSSPCQTNAPHLVPRQSMLRRSETHGFQRDPPLVLPRLEQDHFNKFPHKRKQIGRSANCPCVRCCVRVPGCSWPRPGTARICSTRRSNNVTEAQVHRDVPPPCAPVISGRRAAIDVPLLLCFMHHSGRDR